ncbi:MAG: hypothetical protein CMJ93_00960 [Planctomycetes bacterium]|nr:hypothetical protein [Planctomycetota bacterium]
MTTSALRLLVPSLLILLAGFVGGVAWQTYTGGEKTVRGLDSDLASYLSALGGVLDLNDTQQQDLRLALYYYQQQRDDLFAESLSKVDGQWLELDRRFESLIFSRVLNESQRVKLADLRQPQQLDFTTVQR